MRNKIYLSIYCVSYLFICDPFMNINRQMIQVMSLLLCTVQCRVWCLHSMCNIGFQFEPNFPIKVLRGFEPSRPRMPAAGCSAHAAAINVKTREKIQNSESACSNIMSLSARSLYGQFTNIFLFLPENVNSWV